MSMSVGAGPKHGSAYGEAFHLETRSSRSDTALSSYRHKVINALQTVSIDHETEPFLSNMFDANVGDISSQLGID